MLGTAGGEGDPNARDPVDRESSRMQAVACVFPPTDFLNFGGPGQEKLLARDLARPFRPAFDDYKQDEETNLLAPVVDEARLREITADISPITHVSPDDPPTLLSHGDRGRVVPLQQSEVFVDAQQEVFVDAQQEARVETKLVDKDGVGHGWPTLAEDLESFGRLVRHAPRGARGRFLAGDPIENETGRIARRFESGASRHPANGRFNQVIILVPDQARRRDCRWS